jgi:nuclear transport factor 2 (NTF2) superfamily protein
MEERKVLTEEERKRIDEAWRIAGEKIWKRLQYWKKHNPKKYREFWREYWKLEKAFSEDLDEEKKKAK